MSNKKAINDEIILMRKTVRQSRVRVARKLIKETKLLQARKHGDEKIIEKCQRKALRLLAEIAALKIIKDDDITKFGIMETRGLHEILNDLRAEASTRVTARVAFCKILNDRIIKFKKKFPEYEKHLGPGRKKLSKLQRKAKREAKNEYNENEDANRTITGEKILKIENEHEELSEESGEEKNDNLEDSKDTREPVDGKIMVTEEDETDNQSLEDLTAKNATERSILRIKKPISSTEKETKDSQSEVEPSKPIIEQLEKSRGKSKTVKKEKNKSVTKIPMEPKKSRPIKVISQEATVKRFMDLMEDRESGEIVEETEGIVKSKVRDLKIEKQIDSFFMTGNDDSEYMSVVVPKLKHREDEEQNERFGENYPAKKRKNFNEKNNKFFSKTDRRFDDKGSAAKYPRAEKSKARNSSKPNFEKKMDVMEEELHPSWAARKKQQEVLRQGFQGKKIVFDD